MDAHNGPSWPVEILPKLVDAHNAPPLLVIVGMSCSHQSFHKLSHLFVFQFGFLDPHVQDLILYLKHSYHFAQENVVI